MIVAYVAATQDVMDWIQIGSTFGIPVLLLAGIAFFTVRNIWPFVVKRIEQNDERHRIETERFLTTLDNVTKAHTAETEARDRVQAAQNDAIRNLTDAIKALQQARGSRQQ